MRSRTLMPSLSRAIAWVPCFVPRRASSTLNVSNRTDLPATEFQGHVADNELGFHKGEDPQQERATDESFDEIEASAQELHDICIAMTHYLRRTDPDDAALIRMSNLKHSLRNKTPRNFQRCFNPRSAAGGKLKSFSPQDLDNATTIFLDLGAKLMLHLRKDVMDRMLENTRRLHDVTRECRFSQGKNMVMLARTKSFRQAAYYRHAPFEIQNLRSDIPSSYVDHSRALRDRSTVMSLMALMEPQHPFREQLQGRLLEIAETFNTLATVDRY